MESTDTDRRRFLQLCGAGVALATAGCLGGLGDGGDSSSSPYADALVAEDGVVFASYTVWEPDGLTGDDGTEDGGIGGNGTIGGGNGTIGGGNGTIGGGNSTIGGGNGTIGGGNGTIGGGSGIIGGDTDGEDAPPDPLLTPVFSPFLVGFVAGFGVGVTPLAPLLGVDNPLGGFSGPGGTEDGGEESPDPDSFETEISALLLTVGTGGTALQIRGDIDTDEVDGLLQGSADDGALLGYTRTGEQNGYTRYESEPPDLGNGGDGDADFDIDVDTDMNQISVLAVGSDEILLGGADSIDRLTDDGAESAVSEFDSLAWLLEAAGDGEAGLTVHAPEGTIEDALDSVGNSSQDEGSGTIGPNPGLDNETMGVVEELDTTPLGLSGMARERDGGDTVDIDMGLVFESELGSDPRETIRSTFGTGADDTSFEFDGDRVVISGTFTSGGSEG